MFPRTPARTKRGLRRTVAVSAFLATLLQGFVGGVLACAEISAGNPQLEGHEVHSLGVLQAPARASHAAMHSASDSDATPENIVGERRDHSDPQNPCTMLGHCAANLAAHSIFTLVAPPNGAPVPAVPGWVLHGAPQFGLTPPPKA
jgi:hypothetical protein